jgi:hypothetical protein
MIKKTIIYGATAAITLSTLMYSLPGIGRGIGIRKATGPSLQEQRILVSRRIYQYADKNRDYKLSASEMKEFLENTEPNKEKYRNLHGRFDFDDWVSSHSVEELEKIAGNIDQKEKK